MAEKAQILNHDGTQDVRLPESVRFPEDQQEVIAWREGARVILEPATTARKEWSQAFLDLIGSVDEEIERYPQQPLSSVKNPFE